MLFPVILSSLAAGTALAAAVPQSQIGHSARSRRSACGPQPLGSGPVPSPDDVPTFLATRAFSDAARAADTPAGYNATYTDLRAASNAHMYLGYSTLASYDTHACAARCDAAAGCRAFNIYFERDPSVDPDPLSSSCSDNPPSTTNIKCALWGDHVNECNAVNAGQMRAAFRVAVAGSNGYVRADIALPDGYSCPTSLGAAAVDALSDCGGGYTVQGLKIFTDGAFDIGRCADACSDPEGAGVAGILPHPAAAPSQGISTATAAGNATAASAADSSEPYDLSRSKWPAGQQCRFFNTYTLERNGHVVGQYCVLYNMTWSKDVASNFGSVVGAEKANYTIANSYVASNASDPGMWLRWYS